MKLCLQLDAGHTTAGNPRRVFLVWDQTGRLVDTIDAGYEGRQAWQKKYPKAVDLGSVATTPAQYRELLRDSR